MSEDEDDLIMCESRTCKFQWFHIKCMRIEKIPKGKWFCVKCKMCYCAEFKQVKTPAFKKLSILQTVIVVPIFFIFGKLVQ